MLTSVLPGLRELRAPLSAGFLWLLALWFAGVGVIGWRAGHPGAVPFAALLAVGLGWFGLATLRAARLDRA